MAFASLREFVAHLEKEGWLRRVSAPVSRDLEIAEITDRVSKSAGARNVALLFENVQGFDMPVLINAFGSRERMAAGHARRMAPMNLLLWLMTPGRYWAEPARGWSRTARLIPHGRAYGGLYCNADALALHRQLRSETGTRDTCPASFHVAAHAAARVRRPDAVGFARDVPGHSAAVVDRARRVAPYPPPR